MQALDGISMHAASSLHDILRPKYAIYGMEERASKQIGQAMMLRVAQSMLAEQAAHIEVRDVDALSKAVAASHPAPWVLKDVLLVKVIV